MKNVALWVNISKRKHFRIFVTLLEQLHHRRNELFQVKDGVDTLSSCSCLFLCAAVN